MAKNRSISDRFWYDSYVVDLEPDEKLLFVYLLTNQFVSITGIYELPIRNMVFDTGIEKQRILAILDKFSASGKAHYEDGFIIMANYYKHNSYNMGPVRKHVIQYLEKLPPKIRSKYKNIINNLQALTETPISPYKKSDKALDKNLYANTRVSTTPTYTHTHTYTSTTPLPPQPSISEPEPSASVQSQAGAAGFKKAGGMVLTKQQRDALLTAANGNDAIVDEALRQMQNIVADGEVIHKPVAYGSKIIATLMQTKAKTDNDSAGEAQRRKSPAIDHEKNNRLTAELCARPWYDFDTWADFMRHTINFPDAEALDKYEMPDDLRKRRLIPNMIKNIYMGKSPAPSEEAYQKLRDAYLLELGQRRMDR